MEHEFWHSRWRENRIGFHEAQPNALLVKHFDSLSLNKGAHVFVPLCGKTTDIGWLLQQGFRVTGAELNEQAVIQLFEQLGVVPAVSTSGALILYQGPALRVFVGDIFELSQDQIGAVDAVYDRAALVALPQDMRTEYAAHITQITATAPQFVICFEYDQTAMDGPPFSVGQAEIERLYQTRYAIDSVTKPLFDGLLRGKVDAFEQVWKLSPLG